MDAPSAFETAARRCFTTPEIVHLLSPSTTPLSLSSRTPTEPPPSGSLFLYDRSVVRNYKKDGHDWVRKAVSSKRGTSRVREDDVRLKIGEHCRVAAYYARSATAGGTMRRRAYCLIDPVSLKPEGNLVLVHYLDKGPDEVRQRRDAPSTDTIAHEHDTDEGPRRHDAPKTHTTAHDVKISGKSRPRASRPFERKDGRGSHAIGPVEPERNGGVEKRATLKMVSDADCQGKCPRSDMSQLPSAPRKVSAQQKTYSAVSEFLSAPKITEERMAEEWVSSNDADRSAVISDMYGTAAAADDPTDSLDCNVPNEFTNELQIEILMVKLSLMDDEIAKIPTNLKLCYLEALQQCPHLASPRDVKLQFLRCECFEPRAAAHRLVRYWTKRVEILGRDGAFRPLTLEGTMANDYEDPGFGFVKLLPGLDASGRVIFLCDNTIHSTHATGLRSIWYMFHAALENECAKRKGFIVINNRRPSPEVMNLQCKMEYQSLIRDILPLQLRAIHLCHWKTNDLSGWLVKNVIAVLAFAAGPYMRSRLVFHDGSNEKILLQLAEYGISMHQLPTKMGGSFSDEDFQQWLAFRREAGM